MYELLNAHFLSVFIIVVSIMVTPFLPLYGIKNLITDDNSFLISGLVILLTFIFTVMGIIFVSLSYKTLCLQNKTNDKIHELSI